MLICEVTNTTDTQTRTPVSALKFPTEFVEIARNSDWLPRAEYLGYDINQGYDLELVGQSIYFWHLITQNCARSVDVMRRTGHVLYRGVGRNANSFIGQSRQDRQPRDSLREMQNLIDDFLKQAGFAARRGNSTFAVASQDVAATYGTTMAIFPADDAAITWNADYDDFYFQTKAESAGSLLHRMSNIMSQIDGQDDIYSIVDQVESLADTLFTNLREAVTFTDPASPHLEDIKSWQNTVGMHLRQQEIRKSMPWTSPGLILIDPKRLENMKRSITAALADQQGNDSELYLTNALRATDQLMQLEQEHDLVDQIRHWKLPHQGRSTSTVAQAAAVMGFRQGDLTGALESGHEVYISGTYYAANYSQEPLLNYFIGRFVTADTK